MDILNAMKVVSPVQRLFSCALQHQIEREEGVQQKLSESKIIDQLDRGPVLDVVKELHAEFWTSSNKDWIHTIQSQGQRTRLHPVIETIDDDEERKDAVLASMLPEATSTFTIKVFTRPVVAGMKASVTVPPGWVVLGGGGRMLCRDTADISMVANGSQHSTRPRPSFRYLMTASYPSSLRSWEVEWIRLETLGLVSKPEPAFLFSTSRLPALECEQEEKQRHEAKCQVYAVAIYDPDNMLDTTLMCKPTGSKTFTQQAAAPTACFRYLHGKIHNPNG